jgi:hypothetical protein
MAEAVGLVLGAVALLSTFKDCLDLFQDISAARSLGSDYELLNTKLDIEKTLLLQWADRVRLLHPHSYDSRLDDPVIYKAISSIFSAVQRLLSESTDLQYRYGMKRVDRRTEVIPAMSGTRMNQFLRDFENLNLRIDATQKEASIKQRFCWVVKDKEKFSSLIQELSNLVAKLNDIVPATLEASVDFMTKKDLERIPNLRHLQLVLVAARDHNSAVADLAEKDITVRCQERVLECLWYRTIDDRRNNVTDAHYKTLQWALHPPTPEVEWDDLSEWLRAGSDIYWVSGKAGSGKSTLMKYLYQHADTRSLLEAWADHRRLITANFFFWYLGTPEQKTHEGLSRGLLYHVLNADPSLIPILLPNMWREAHRADKATLDLPSESEMRTAFSTLSNEITTERFCFFIDGLDEYSGDHLNGIAFLKSLVSSGNIKAIVSSRPISSCFQALSNQKTLQLQDLTREDIKTYVDDIIGIHPHTQDLVAIDPEGVNGILEDLVNKASGVFLWVVLACRSLLEGFAAFDYPDELQRRVNELPPELESLFKHMLDRIEPRYQRQAAKLLRVCLQTRMNPEPEAHLRAYYDNHPLRLSIHPGHRNISQGICTLGLSLVDEYDLDMRRFPDRRELSFNERRMKCKVLEARLRSRCCGLLEVHKSTGLLDSSRCFCGHEVEYHGPTDDLYHAKAKFTSTSNLDPLVDSVIEFMHRSVFEFLINPEVWNLDCLQIDTTSFEPNAILSRMNLHLLYISAREEHPRRGQVNEMVRESLLCAKYADSQFNEATVTTILDFSLITFEIIEALKISSYKNAMDDYPFFVEVKKRVQPSKKARSQLAFLLAVELGMINVVRYWETMGVLSFSQKTPLLYHAIFRPFTSWLPSFGLDVSTEMVTYLLSKGCDPNQVFLDESRQKTTPWKCWLLDMRSSTDRQSASLAAEITTLFLNADADVSIPINELRETLESLLSRRLLGHRLQDKDFDAILNRDEKMLSSQCDELLQLIALKKSLRNTDAGATGREPAKLTLNTENTGSEESSLVAGVLKVRGASKRSKTESAMTSKLGSNSTPNPTVKRRKVFREDALSDALKGDGHGES